MDTPSLCAAAVLTGVGSGFIPLVNTEAFLLGVAATSPAGALLPVALCTTAGQMLAKLGLYLAGRGILRLPVRGAARVEALRAQLGARPAGGLLFGSATVGVPPFYLVSVAAGALRVPLALFLAVGFAGRLLRFACVLGLPSLIQGLLP